MSLTAELPIRMKQTQIKQPHAQAPWRVENLLQEILTDIAKVLITSGYGVSGLNGLAKRAYLSAAQSLGQPGEHKITNARVAALTGLTRTEVTRLSRSRRRPGELILSPFNRAHRVSMGWVSDKEFCTRSGRPRELQYSNHRNSFEQLVKRYSGDIPARAMLSEMTRLGMAAESPLKTVRLIQVDTPLRRQTLAALGAIKPWTEFLADDQSDEDRQLKANTARIQLNFESLPQLLAVVRELQGRAEAFVRSVRELGPVKKSRAPHRLDVSIALATRIPKSIDSAKRKGKRAR